MPSNWPQSDTAGGGAAAPRPWWLGGLVIALGCVCLYGAFSLPQAARYAGVGPGLFVTLVGSGLVLLGLLLLMQIARGEKFVPQDTEDASGSDKADMTAFLTALAAAIVPVLTIEALGVPFTAMLSFTLVSVYLVSSGTPVAGLALFLWGSVELFIVDKTLRPRLVGGPIKLPFLPTFFGLIGGVKTMGFIGLFIGPVLMALLVAIWREWIREVDATDPATPLVLDEQPEPPPRLDKERNVG